MSTDPIGKSGPTCPYSTSPGFVRATRLLLAVAFATALAGCQHVPTDLSDSPITPTPASDRVTTGSREVGVPEPQTQVQMVDEASVSEYLPDICQKIREVNQIYSCYFWYHEIGNEIDHKMEKFYHSEFNRRIEQENRNLKNIFSIIHDMKEHNFDVDRYLLGNVAIGRIMHLPSKLNNMGYQFNVFTIPSWFWGRQSEYDPEHRDLMKTARDRRYQKSLDDKDIVISVDILIARNNRHLEFAQTSPDWPIIEIIPQKEVLINYHIIDFQNNLSFKGVFPKRYEDGTRKRYPIGVLPDPDLSSLLEKSISELQSFEASDVFVSAWDIIDHFLSGASEERRIPEDIKNAQGKVFQWLDEESRRAKEKIYLCRSPLYLEPSTNSSDENILNPDELMKRIVYISAPNATGTGFYIDDNLVLTNHHVIESSLETHDLPIVDIEKFGKDGKFSGMVVGYDHWRDLALLSVEEAGTPFPIHKGKKPPIGAVVSAFGHPRDIRWIYTRGAVSGYTESDGVPVVVTDAAINPGNSGGPLIYAGKVIGINSWSYVNDDGHPAEGLNYAVRYDEIHAFLRQQGLDLFREPGQIVHDEEAIMKCYTDAQQPSR